MKDELKAFGFSEKETEIYISSLKIGESTTNRIAKISGINRTTVYDILEGLKKKGFAYSYQKDKKIYYGVVKPEKLIESSEQKADMIKSVLPDLNLIIGKVFEKPKVVMYEGKTGLMQASYDMLKEKEILGYGANGKFDVLFEMFQANFARRRVENKVYLRAIIEVDVPEHMLEDDVKKFTELRRLLSFRDSEVSKFIYGSKVLMLVYGEEPVAIIISSEEYANSQRIVFEELWKVAK